jgi:hypothetical protein
MGAPDQPAPPFFVTQPADAVIASRSFEPVPSRTSELHPEIELVEALGEDGILVDEITQTGYASWYAFPVYSPRTLITSGYAGNLGYGYATAVGVKVASPDRRVVAISTTEHMWFGVWYNSDVDSVNETFATGNQTVGDPASFHLKEIEGSLNHFSPFLVEPTAFVAGATYTLVVACQTITVNNPANANGTANAAFSETFTQTGAFGSATFTLASGTLPTGLTLSTVTFDMVNPGVTVSRTAYDQQVIGLDFSTALGDVATIRGEAAYRRPFDYQNRPYAARPDLQYALGADHNFGSFSVIECLRDSGAEECDIFRSLIGSRMLVANIEVHAPVPGMFTGEIEYGRFPVDLVAFADAGENHIRLGPRGDGFGKIVVRAED